MPHASEPRKVRSHAEIRAMISRLNDERGAIDAKLKALTDEAGKPGCRSEEFNTGLNELHSAWMAANHACNGLAWAVGDLGNEAFLRLVLKKGK